jgi:hypothetical protein
MDSLKKEKDCLKLASDNLLSILDKIKIKNVMRNQR